MIRQADALAPGSAGVALDDGVGKVVTVKSRTWFEKQEWPSTQDGRAADEESR